MSEEYHKDPTFTDTPNISHAFLRQLDRCNNYAGTEFYSEAVRQLLHLLPVNWRSWVLQNADRYNPATRVLVYRKNCGYRMGRANDPLVENERGDWGYSSESGFDVNRLEDGSVDWDDPRIISPTLRTETKHDDIELFATVMEAAEYAGLIWGKKGHRRRA